MTPSPLKNTFPKGGGHDKGISKSFCSGTPSHHIPPLPYTPLLIHFTDPFHQQSPPFFPTLIPALVHSS